MKGYAVQMNNKYNSIDLWKFIMVFAVVASHTNPLVNINNDSILKIYNMFLSVVVPFYLLSSGYLIAVKMNWDYKDDDFDKLKKHLFKIVKMYLIWTLVYLPMTINSYFSKPIAPKKAILHFISNFIFVGEQYNSWHLWYLLSTVYALMTICIIMKMCRKPECLIILSAIASVLCMGLTAFARYEGTYISALENVRWLVKWTIVNGRIFTGLIYIPLGMLLSRKRIPKMLNLAMLIGAGIILFFVENEFVSGYLSLFSSVGLFGLIISVSLPDHRIYARLRSHSTVIYLIHMYIWGIYYMIIYGQKTFGLDSYLVTSAIALVLAVLYYSRGKLIKRLS